MRGCLCAVLSAMCAGCGSPYLGKPIPPAENALVLAEVLEKEREGIEVLKADLTLKVRGRLEDRGFSHRLKGENALFTAQKARARFCKALGLVKALDVAVNPDNITVYLPWNDKAYVGDAMAYLLERKRVPADFTLDPLSLFFPLLQTSPTVVETSKKYYIVECDMGGGFQYRYQHLVYSGLMVRKELLKDGKPILYFSYERHRETGGKAVPTLVRFGTPQGNLRGWLRAGDFAFNPKIKDRAFSIRLPPGTKVMKIEEKEEEKP